MHPLWQAVWRMCLHTLLFFTFPPSWKEGGQGDGAVPHYGACKRGVQRGAPLWQVVWRMCLHKLLFFTSPLPGSGESRGEHPHWQAVWRMCLHKLHFFTFPPSWKEGGQGDGAVPHYGACKRGSPEGCTPTGRLQGIPRYNEGGVTCLRPPTFQEHKELFL